MSHIAGITLARFHLVLLITTNQLICSFSQETGILVSVCPFSPKALQVILNSHLTNRFRCPFLNLNTFENIMLKSSKT